MTVNTRTSIFETNSSSSHSITLCISPSKCMDSIPLTDDGDACIYPGEFGWGPSQHNDAPTKASYCLVHAMSSIPSRWKNADSEDLHDDGKPRGPQDAENEELALPLVQMLERVIKRGTNCNAVKFIPTHDGYRWGYIDHQSVHVPTDIFKDDDVLFGFIFNPKSELCVDNDNH